MRNIAAMIALIFIAALALAGCNESEKSYASILIYEDREYIGKHVVSKEKYQNIEEVGVVLSKTEADELPEDDFSSNEMKIGTKIYKETERHDTLLLEYDIEQYKVFEVQN
ncbi:hypothetical protein [Paenibacillus lemnae]|uniref:DUF3221 domain-containing protein n=1 Tax=Paenibacillus lemnae TaxID=1330551 RepID=A0A848M8M4_PAELE|nr:hypothetical protein [Paenibacillus lemnae]NMO96432.1 hypothetical protein [Paenibacillus lemnae]